MSENIKKRHHFIVDWMLVILLYAIKLFISQYFEPHERQFSLDDATISYPYKGDTVTMTYLVTSFVSIALIIILITPLFKKNIKYNCHQAILGLLLSICTTDLVSIIIKTMVGRYRPDFIAVCDVDFQKVEEQYNYYRNITSSEDYGPRNIFNTSICKASKRDLLQERKSFPSGHSAFAFSSMTFIALYIAGQIHLLNKKKAYKVLLVGTPLILALMVVLSRIMDNRHHWQDVTVGSLIGMIFAIVFYFTYYPNLKSSKCDIPYQLQDDENYIKEQNPMQYFN